MNATAQVVSDTGKYDRGLKTILYYELHWLNVHERTEYKLGVMVYWCLYDRAAYIESVHENCYRAQSQPITRQMPR